MYQYVITKTRHDDLNLYPKVIPKAHVKDIKMRKKRFNKILFVNKHEKRR